VEFKSEYVMCLRSCLMKPEHLDCIAEIWKLLDQATQEAWQAAG